MRWLRRRRLNEPDAARGGQRRMRAKFRRRLTLSHDGEPFLDRWGLVWDRVGGFYLHHIADADPGIDVHDHPWSFVSFVLKGGYVERIGTARQPYGGQLRFWGAGSVHRMPLHAAHQITLAQPGTWTLVLRGPTVRRWGFFVGDSINAQWVAFDEYDYETRRPTQARGNSIIGDPTAVQS